MLFRADRLAEDIRRIFSKLAYFIRQLLKEALTWPISRQAFGIKLQWYRGEDQVDSMSKVMGLFCQQRQVQNQILDQMLINLNALNCTHFPIPGQHYQLMVKSLISS
jgi:hypothetical protein